MFRLLCQYESFGLKYYHVLLHTQDLFTNSLIKDRLRQESLITDSGGTLRGKEAWPLTRKPRPSV